MGCNCKRKINNEVKKFGTDEDIIKETKETNILKKIILFLLRLVVGFTIGCIIIIILVPILIFTVFNIMLGRQTKFKIPFLNKSTKIIKNKQR